MANPFDLFGGLLSGALKGNSMVTVPSTVTAPVKSAWASKINWAQWVGGASILVSLFGVTVPDDVKTGIIAAIGGGTMLVTWILRTWFTKTIVAPSVPAAIEAVARKQ